MDTNLSMNNNYKNSEFPATSVFWAITNFTPLLLLEAHAHWLWQIRYSLYTLFCLSSTVRLQLYCFLRTKQQTQNGVTHAKPHVMKPRLKLSHSFDSPRNRILTSPSETAWSAWVKHSAWQTSTLPSRRVTLRQHAGFSPWYDFLVPASLCLFKFFPWVQLLGGPFCLLDWMPPDSWIVI